MKLVPIYTGKFKYCVLCGMLFLGFYYSITNVNKVLTIFQTVCPNIPSIFKITKV